MRIGLIVLATLATLTPAPPILAEDDAEANITPLESAVILMMSHTEGITQATKQKLGLYRDDVCLRATLLAGGAQVSFPLHIPANTELLITASSPRGGAKRLSIEAYSESGEPIGGQVGEPIEKDEGTLVMYAVALRRSQKGRIVIKRLDTDKAPQVCAVSICAENGYVPGAKALRDAASLLASWPSAVTEIHKKPADTIKPVNTQGVWICTGFTLNRAESIDIGNVRSTSRSAMILATFDNKKADVDAFLSNRAGEIVEEDVEQDRNLAFLWWKPERAQTYTLKLTNEGSEETLVFYARFDVDFDIPEDSEQKGETEDTITPTKTL